MQEMSQVNIKHKYFVFNKFIFYQLKVRMTHFDDFYEKNYADPQISYFEKQKLRLRRVITSYLDIEDIKAKEAAGERKP